MKEPSITETAFSCPHCGAYTTQYWHVTMFKFIKDDRKVPFLPPDDIEERIRAVKEWDEEKKYEQIENSKKSALN